MKDHAAIMTLLRDAFDGETVSLKNIALRKAYDFIERSSRPAQCAPEPVAWQKRPTFGDFRMWSYLASPDDDNHQFWLDQDYEIRPLYASTV